MTLRLVCGLVFAWLLASAAMSVNLITANGPVHAQAAQTDGKTESRTAKGKTDNGKDQLPKLPAGVPAKVGTVLQYIDEHRRPPDDYEGGRVFGNFEGLLPKRDARGRPIKYHEWDVNPKVRGKNRGPERLVTGSDGSAYYSADHYKSFKKIR
jgi:guanyl-specific ribonuclease Sa